MMLMALDLRVSILRREQFNTSLAVARFNKVQVQGLLLVQSIGFGYTFSLAFSAPPIAYPVQRPLNPFVKQHLQVDPCAAVTDDYLSSFCEQSLSEWLYGLKMTSFSRDTLQQHSRDTLQQHSRDILQQHC